jgi:methionyl-tRNA formyltransferase
VSSLRIVFAGTPEFARVALDAVAAAGFEVALVLTQPDRPAGRGMKLQASAVKHLALQRGWPVAQPRSLRLDGKYPEDALAARSVLEIAQADVMVVAAYGLILPQWVLDVPRLGCLNIHASLLPRWRGAAPIHRAVEAGDAQTGITVMQMDAGLDTGAMLKVAALDIGDDSTARLHDRLAELGGQLIVDVLRQAETGALHPALQPAEGATYARKVEKHEAMIDWAQPAADIVRRIRAFDPFPGATSVLGGETVKLWAAQAALLQPPGRVHPDEGPEVPGSVLAVMPSGIAVAAADATVLLTELQRAGGKRLPAADFLRGFDIEPGQVFGN